MNNPIEESSSQNDVDSEKNKTNEQTTTPNAVLEAISAELVPQPEPMLTDSSNHKRLHEQSSPIASPDLDATIKKIKTSEPDEQQLVAENIQASAAPSTYSQHSVENFLPSPSNQPEKHATEDIDLAEIIVSDELGLQKSVELAEILENPDDLLKESDDASSSLDEKSRNDSMDFDITEKLREMGEISVKPISKAELTMNRKSESGDGVDDVSFELSKKDNLASANERKVTNLRKNIREVMDDTQLDASTLAAQRQELERLARVQEQQRIIRDVQRQIAAERQSNKTQARVMSLLQGHSSRSQAGSSAVGLPQTSGATITKISAQHVRDRLSSDAFKKIDNITPSVSIAQVRVPATVKREKPEHKKKRPFPSEQFEEFSDVDDDYDEDYDEDFDEDDESMSSLPAARRPVVESTATIVKKDVVTIDSSSDDDCIVLSDDDEEEEEDTDDDPHNSGLHVNDTYNIPDDQGRVVINIGHPENEADIFLAPQISRIIKPHQIGGVRFLFDNLIESIDRFDTSTGFGCILAHSMGLGKTLQLVCFCDIFLRHTSAKNVLIIMPINTLQNWLSEFNMWLPDDPEKSPGRAHGEVRPRQFKLYVLNDSHKSLTARSNVVLDWAKSGGVLLIGYEMYRLLSMKKNPKKKKKKRKDANGVYVYPPPPDEDDEKAPTEQQKNLFDRIHSALVSPGPDLVICDEGHRIKNSHASTSVALKKIHSKRRVVLTGYPLQNNLQEYWCMVDFVRPNYLGTKTEFANMFERPIQNGQCIDSTPQDIKLMRYRAHVLHSLLLGFVQRRSHDVLQLTLPQKNEYVMLVRMTAFQKKLYSVFMDEVVRTKAVPNPLKAFAVCCKIWNHPDVLYNFLKKREADLEIELEEQAAIEQATAAGEALPTKKRGRKSTSPKKGANLGAAKKISAAQSVSKDGKLIPAAAINPSTNTTLASAAAAAASVVAGADTQPTFNDFKIKHESQTPVALSHQNPVANNYSNVQSLSQPSSSNNQLQQQQYSSNYGNYGNTQMGYDQQQQSSYGQYNNSSNGNYYGSNNSNGSFNSTGMSNGSYYPGYGENYSNYQQPTQQNGQNYWSNNTNNNYYNQSNQQQQGYDQSNYPNYQSNNYAYDGNGQNYSSSSYQAQQPTNPASYMQQPLKTEPTVAPYQSNATTNATTPYSMTPTTSVPPQTHFSSHQHQPASSYYNTETDQMKPPKTEPMDQIPGAEWPLLEAPLIKDEKPVVVDEKAAKTEITAPADEKPIITESKTDVKDVKDVVDVKSDTDSKEELTTDIPTEVLEDKDITLDKEIVKTSSRDDGIPYEWAVELMKGYVPDLLENAPKLEIFFCILEESVRLGDRMLVFSQSLLTLNLMEKFLQKTKIFGTEKCWARNESYFRLDGSTPAQDREKLINEFNSNANVILFLVSTRAGSLGINLVGANRVIVLDASWNPCHDTQAVCRVYRYGQKKPCFVYRLVMDNCLEKKIYDRQINKQGMADRVIDECNPDAHLSMREVTSLCWNDGEESIVSDYSEHKDKYIDIVMQKVLEAHSKHLTKEPFQHESLLVDRKEKKLSSAEKRLAQRGYELEKQATAKPTYSYTSMGTTYRAYKTPDGAIIHRPVASVRPMQAEDKSGTARPGGARPTRWIPAEVWQRQGMTAQEMTLPIDVVIPTNSAEKSNIVLKAGEKVMVLKSTKGIYMQLQTGKIIAIRTAMKAGATGQPNSSDVTKMLSTSMRPAISDAMTNMTNVNRGRGRPPGSTNAPNLFKTQNPTPKPVLDAIKANQQLQLKQNVVSPSSNAVVNPVTSTKSNKSVPEEVVRATTVANDTKESNSKVEANDAEKVVPNKLLPDANASKSANFASAKPFNVSNSQEPKNDVSMLQSMAPSAVNLPAIAREQVEKPSTFPQSNGSSVSLVENKKPAQVSAYNAPVPVEPIIPAAVEKAKTEEPVVNPAFGSKLQPTYPQHSNYRPTYPQQQQQQYLGSSHEGSSVQRPVTDSTSNYYYNQQQQNPVYGSQQQQRYQQNDTAMDYKYSQQYGGQSQQHGGRGHHFNDSYAASAAMNPYGAKPTSSILLSSEDEDTNRLEAKMKDKSRHLSTNPYDAALYSPPPTSKSLKNYRHKISNSSGYDEDEPNSKSVAANETMPSDSAESNDFTNVSYQHHQQQPVKKQQPDATTTQKPYATAQYPQQFNANQTQRYPATTPELQPQKPPSSSRLNPMGEQQAMPNQKLPYQSSQSQMNFNAPLNENKTLPEPLRQPSYHSTARPNLKAPVNETSYQEPSTPNYNALSNAKVYPSQVTVLPNAKPTRTEDLGNNAYHHDPYYSRTSAQRPSANVSATPSYVPSTTTNYAADQKHYGQQPASSVPNNHTLPTMSFDSKPNYSIHHTPNRLDNSVVPATLNMLPSSYPPMDNNFNVQYPRHEMHQQSQQQQPPPPSPQSQQYPNYTNKTDEKKEKKEEKSDNNPPKEEMPVAEAKPPAPVSAPPTKDTQKQINDTPAPAIAQTDIAPPASVATATPKNQSAFHRPDNAPLTPSVVEAPGYIAPPVPPPTYHTPGAVHPPSAYQYPYSPNPLSTPQSYLPPPHSYGYPEPYGMPTYHPSSTYATPYSPYLPAEGTPYSAYHHHPLAPTQPSTYPYPPYPPTMPQQWQ